MRKIGSVKSISIWSNLALENAQFCRNSGSPQNVACRKSFQRTIIRTLNCWNTFSNFQWRKYFFVFLDTIQASRQLCTFVHRCVPAEYVRNFISIMKWKIYWFNYLSVLFAVIKMKSNNLDCIARSRQISTMITKSIMKSWFCNKIFIYLPIKNEMFSPF